MNRIRQSIQIARKPETVFDFVTTARTWLQWHPATRAVDGPGADHSAQIGEEIVESIQMGLFRGVGAWQVTECRRPRRWAIRSRDPAGRGAATIAYDLESSPVGTRFERTLEYELHGLYALADWLFLNALMRRQSIRALENLKRLLESSR